MQTNSIKTSFFLWKYQRVEYIWRNGNNYIDTLRVPKLNQQFEVHAWIKIASSWVRYWILSNYNQQSWESWLTSLEINDWWWHSNNVLRFYSEHLSWSNSYNIFSSNSLNTSSFNDLIYICNWNSTSWKVSLNWTITNWNVYTWWYSNLTAYVFIDRALRRSTFNNNSFISYLKIYENWTLIKDFVPAYRKSDWVIWMVEKVSKTFYTNKGSWTFSKWWNIPR